ncbi:LolA-like protein [Spirosoma fluminis]
MKKQLITLVALVAIPAFTFAQTASEVVGKHITALGGADKIAAIKTAEYEQTMSVMGMDMQAKTTLVVGKSSRSEISVMGQQITSVVDGDKGWAINPMQGGNAPQELPADQVKLQKNNTEPTGLQLAYVQMNKVPYELVGKEKRDGKDVYNIKVAKPEGVYNYYLDAATYQLVASKTVMNVQGQSVEGTATYNDYKQVDGVNLPHTLEISGAGMPGTMTAKVTKLTLNSKVDPGIFAMPK